LFNYGFNVIYDSQQEAKNNNHGFWGSCEFLSSQEQTKNEFITEQTKTEKSSVGGKWYTSSYHTAKYYYHESCQGWQGLSEKYLQIFNSETELLSKYKRTLHRDCNP
jgi:hypothetical protein